MTQLALVDVPTEPALTLVHSRAEETDGQLDTRSRWYTRWDWTPTPDDARALADAIVARVIEDLADHRARKRAHLLDAHRWLQDYRYEACDLGWCAVALGMSPGGLRLDIRRRVAERETEKAAHAEDLRRRRAGAVRLIVDRSSWAGHVMLAALVSRVMGGEWEAGRG